MLESVGKVTLVIVGAVTAIWLPWLVVSIYEFRSQIEKLGEDVRSALRWQFEEESRRIHRQFEQNKKTTSTKKGKA